MPLRVQYGLSIGIALAVLFWIGAQPRFAALIMTLGGCLVVGAVKLDSWLTERSRRARLIRDADYEHTAWKAGDDRTAVFGRFQPPWMVLHSDGCTPEQCVCPDRKVSS